MMLKKQILINLATILLSIFSSLIVCQLCQRREYSVVETYEGTFVLHSEANLNVFLDAYRNAIKNNNFQYSKIKILLEGNKQEFCYFIGKYLICDMEYTVTCRSYDIKSVFDNYKENYEGKDIKHFYFTNSGYAINNKRVNDLNDMLYWCQKEYSLNNKSFYILHIEEDMQLKKIWSFLVKVNQLFGERFIICKYDKNELNDKIDKNLFFREENLPSTNIQENISL